MTLPEAIRSIIKNYKTLLLTAEGAAIDPSRDSIAPEKAGTKRPRDFGNEAVELEQRVVRLARVTTAQMKALAFNRFNEDGDRHHPVKKATRVVILEEEGSDAVEVAFLYDVTEAHVKRVRREAGRDPDTGERVTRLVPLTEPAGDTLKRSRSDDGD